MKNKLSALMDGELDAAEATEAIAQLKKMDGLRGEWATYHLIGDALRQSVTMPDIAQRVSERLAAEPTVLAPRSLFSLHLPMQKAKVFALSAAASVAAVAVVGWISFHTVDQSRENLAAGNNAGNRTSLNAVQVATSASVPPPAQMNDYLLAHQEFSPSTAMQGVAPYVRTVADSQGQGR